MSRVCTTCGKELDALGICPDVSSIDAARQTAPINCVAVCKHDHDRLCNCLTCTILAQLASKETAPCILF
jgi:hypothetical protein